MNIRMVEIYEGNDQKWKGWHNLILDINDDVGDSKCIQGPIDPETSKQLIEVLGIDKEYDRNYLKLQVLASKLLKEVKILTKDRADSGLPVWEREEKSLVVDVK